MSATETQDDGSRPPSNLKAELAVLGAILIDNQRFDDISAVLSPDDFYEPVHRRIYEACATAIARGRLADHTTLYHLFDTDPALAELDGGVYLERIARAAELIVDPVEYARVVHDLAVRRRIVSACETIASEARGDGIDELAEFIERSAEKILIAGRETRNDRGLVPIARGVDRALDAIAASMKRPGGVVGLATGLTDLDEKLGGLQRADLIVLAGRPGMGKSALASTIALNVASQEGNAVAFFSLEMPNEQIAMRLIAARAGVPVEVLRRGDIPVEWNAIVFDAAKAIAELPIFIDSTPDLSVESLRIRARHMRRTRGLSLVIVDYLQLLRTATNYEGPVNRVAEISEISRALKNLAKDLDVPVLALSQLSRAVESREDKRPHLADLRDSGTIEQDADVVIFVYRDEYYIANSEPKRKADESDEKYEERLLRWHQRLKEAKGIAELIIAKQRNGPTDTVKVAFHNATCWFSNLTSGGGKP